MKIIRGGFNNLPGLRGGDNKLKVTLYIYIYIYIYITVKIVEDELPYELFREILRRKKFCTAIYYSFWVMGSPKT